MRGRSIIVTAWKEQQFIVLTSLPQSLKSQLWKPTTFFKGSQVGKLVSCFKGWSSYPSNYRLDEYATGKIYEDDTIR